MNIYTSIEEAAKIIKERWNDKELQKKVAERIKGQIPSILLSEPIGLIGRNVGTPDGEFARFIALNKIAGTRPTVFEYRDDKLVVKNISKYSLVKMPFYTGNLKDANQGVEKIKIIDFRKAEGSKISGLKTLWGENLVNFHHRILFDFYPGMKKRIIDVSNIFKEGFHPREYYNLVFSLSISHSIYFEDFFSTEGESDFVNTIVLPAFEEVTKYFDVKPIVVRISNADNEYKEVPYNLFYPKKVKDIVEQSLKNKK